MTAYNFPNSPAVGDIVTASGISYRWNGSRWVHSTGAVTAPVRTTNNGICDLNLASHFKMPITYAGSVLSITQSFINLPSGSWKATVELVQDRGSYQIVPASLTYDSTRASPAVTGVDGSPVDLWFKPDGTILYILGNVGRFVFSSPLLVPWDVTTLPYFQDRNSAAFVDIDTTGMYMSPDGVNLYIIGAGSDVVYRYVMSTPWKVSTLSSTPTQKSISAQETTPRGVTFKPDGTKMYILGSGNDTVYSYTLSTAWDVTTATYDAISFAVTAGTDTAPTKVRFNNTGTKMYILGATLDIVFSYTLSTAWNISTAVYDASVYNHTTIDTGVYGLYIKDDSGTMYITGLTNDKIYPLLSTFATITWDSRIKWADSKKPVVTATGKQIIEFYSPDGTEIYGKIAFDGTT